MSKTGTMDPTPYRVSTITCNASISTTVDLSVFFEHVKISSNGIVWSEFGKNNKGTNVKKKSPSSNKKDSFDNQVTVILYMQDGYYPNIKIFRNGSIQMTGIRTEKDGLAAVSKIEEEIRRIATEESSCVVGKLEDLKAGEFKIRMINSDFGFPFKIRRKNLHQLLISDKYMNACSFQPLTYPGVKLQYFWNAAMPNNMGVCKCTEPCYGTGKNECKKVTVSVFDSGKILITGANSFDQVNEAYKYICDVIKDNRHELMKVLPDDQR